MNEPVKDMNSLAEVMTLYKAMVKPLPELHFVIHPDTLEKWIPSSKLIKSELQASNKSALLFGCAVRFFQSKYMNQDALFPLNDASSEFLRQVREADKEKQP